MQSYFKITNLLCEWHAGFCGGYFSPSACKKQKSLVHPLESLLSCIPQLRQTDSVCVLCMETLWTTRTTPRAVCESKKNVMHVILRTSAMHAFLCHETNFFCVSTTSGLLHDVFQNVSVHPIPIEICYGLLRYALTFLLGMCRYPMRLWTVTAGKLSVDIHLA
jgi:hypothetical protein